MTVPGSTDWTAVPDSGDPGSSTGDETRVTVFNLNNATQYAFEFRAVNSVGDGTKAGPVTATTVMPTCGAPNLVSRGKIWTGNLTVAPYQGPLDTPTDYGFVELGGAIGFLDDKDFTIGANNYEIDISAVSALGDDTGDLRFSLKDANLTTAEKAALRLHVCDRGYDFSTAHGPNSAHTYSWAAELDWSLLGNRTLHLSIPVTTVAHVAAGATGRPHAQRRHYPQPGQRRGRGAQSPGGCEGCIAAG